MQTLAPHSSACIYLSVSQSIHPGKQTRKDDLYNHEGFHSDSCYQLRG